MTIITLLFNSHLEKDEKIRYVAHRHIFTEYKKICKNLFLGILLPGAFYLLLPPFQVIWSLWALIGLLKLVYNLANWYLDTWLITNLSIIDTEWNGFFNRNSTRVEYQAIKGVSYEIKGFWNTILRFGDVNLELSALNTKVVLKDACFPKKVERNILDAQAAFMNNKSFEDHEALKEILTGMLERERIRK